MYVDGQINLIPMLAAAIHRTAGGGDNILVCNGYYCNVLSAGKKKKKGFHSASLVRAPPSVRTFMKDFVLGILAGWERWEVSEVGKEREVTNVLKL